MKRKLLAPIVGGALLITAFAATAWAAPRGTVTKEAFGTMPDGRAVDLYTLSNGRGMVAKITNYGGIVTSLQVPDRGGKADDVVLGFDTLAQYLKDNPLFGALVGRYANRIRDAKFTLDGQTYQLAKNNGPNHIHGGNIGFDKVLWLARPVQRAGAVGVELRHFSADGNEGYPGNLMVKVVYTLTEKNELKIEYSAVTDQNTILNLTHHSYFNLAGAGNGDVLGHVMRINADRFTPIGSDLIPTGVVQDVAGTPLDFRTPTAIGARINDDNEQLKFAGGYDHNFVLNRRDNAPSLAARVYEPKSGRAMAVYTTEPGLVFYTGNFLNGVHGKGGKIYDKHFAFCLETGHFPDSPAHANFPSTVLKPGQTYRQTTIYRFFAQ